MSSQITSTAYSVWEMTERYECGERMMNFKISIHWGFGVLGFWGFGVVGDALDEGRAHVDADFADGLGRAAMGCEVIGERGDGGGVAAFGGEQHAGLVDIDEQRDVVVAAPRGGLVDGDPRDAEASARARA